VASKPANLRRLGTVLLLGVAAGYGARYVASKLNERAAQSPKQLIDWQQARRYALRVSQWDQVSIPDRDYRREQYTRLVEQSEPLIAEYLGVSLPEPIKHVYVVDRREWLEANFTSFETIFAPIEKLYLEMNARQGSFGSTLGQINSKVIGAQMGVLLGFLARRVLGQYDLSLLSPDIKSRGSLYFVEPNIARVQQNMGLSDEDYRLWIALHETTHVFQFEAYPWVRPYFNELLGQFLGQVNSHMETLGVSVPQMINRLLGNRSNGQHWVERVLSNDQQKVFDQIQALMSIVEGYSNHMMNSIGEKLLPSFQEIERRMNDRQQNRPLLEELFNRITGMDLKMAQYKQGEEFVLDVVATHGLEFMNQVWEKPENLPTMEEIRNPRMWVERMGG
jgi:coenzyme F420 biosynthesis associated uncharacterized protein